VVDDELRRLALERAPHAELLAAARAQGMRTLLEDGTAKALAGLTTLDELRHAIADDGAGAFTA